MALLPPAKRARLSLADDADSDDDDELLSRPEEVSHRRDPDVKLSRHRAHSEFKLQSKMDSIFEKYSHDFEGVGDEIDMETGEVVVDNGHLTNLEDGKAFDVEPTEEEEEMLISGRWSGGEATKHNQLVRSASFAPMHQPFGSMMTRFANPMGMPSVQSDPFGVSPLALGPWGFPGDSMGPPGFGTLGPLDFPMRPNVGFGPAQHPLKTVQTIYGSWRKAIMAGPARAESVDTDDDADEADEAAILMGRRSGDEGPDDEDDKDDLVVSGLTPLKHPPASPNDGSRPKVLSGAGLPSPQPSPVVQRKTRGRPRKADVVATKTLKSTDNPLAAAQTAQRTSSKSHGIEELVEKRTKEQIAPSEEERTRSGRVSKRPDYLGNKISWAKTRKNRNGAAGLRTAAENDAHDRQLGTGEQDVEIPCSLDGDDEEQVQVGSSPGPAKNGRLVDLIPDSQRTTPFTSSAPSGIDNGSAKNKLQASVQSTWDPFLCELSDEEAPILVRRPTGKKGRPRRSTNRPSPALAETASGPQEEGQQLISPPESHKEDAGDESLETTAPVHLRKPKLWGEAQRLRKLQEASPVLSEALKLVENEEETGRRRSRHPSLSKLGTERLVVGAMVTGVPPEETPLSSKAGMGDLDNAPGMTASDHEPSSSPLRARRRRGRPPKQKEGPQGDEPTVTEATTGEPQSSEFESTERYAKRNEIPETDAEPDSSAPDGLPIPGSRSAAVSTPRKQKKGPKSSTPQSASKTPKTPRHRLTSSALKAPSSRRSILSLVPDDDSGDDSGDGEDELSFSLDILSSSIGQTTKRKWRSSDNTTETYLTPVKRKRREPVSPGAEIKTPGGTTRTCGLSGFRCKRDFCFHCM